MPHEHNGDICRVKDLDLYTIRKQQYEEIDKFWENWKHLKKTGKQQNPTYNPRDIAISLGLLTIKDSKDLSKNDKIYHKWKDTCNNLSDNFTNKCDVYSSIGYKSFIKTYKSYFCPIRTHVFLDKNGWVESKNIMEYSDGFWELAIDNSDQDDILVIIDCYL